MRAISPSPKGPIHNAYLISTAYGFLDPHTEHARLAGWIVGIAVAGVVIFAITRTLCWLRERLAARYGVGRALAHRASFTSEGSGGWETVERPGSRLV